MTSDHPIEQSINSITFDGPAASGKSTIAKKLAEHFDYLFFDTGVMYRAVTLAVLENGLDVNDEETCTRFAEKTKIDVRPASKEDGRPNDILIDGEDKTWGIRQPDPDGIGGGPVR